MSLTLTWYGHAAFGLDVNGTKLLVDPFLNDNPASAVKADEVDADFILVSHGHGDHIGDAIAIAKRTGALIISTYEVASWFENQGLKAHSQHIGGGFQYPFGYLKLTIAVHGSRLPDGTCGGNPAGFLLTTPTEEMVYLACDTGLFTDMRLIGEEGIDLAALPIGDNYTMGPDDALRAVNLLEPKHVIPVHYSTWEIIEQDPYAWAERVKQETAAIPHVLQPGESFQL